MSNGLDRPVAAPRIAESFDAVVVPHLDAGYRLARWLMRDEHDAEDVVQEASLRAFRYFRTFCGGDARAWFLRIVRNTCYGWRRRGFRPPTDPFDEEQHSSARPQADPETLLLRTDHAAYIARAISRLPDRLHQVLILREVEDLSYRELSEVIGVPVGTVMSRLSRAREALRGAVDNELKRPGMSSAPCRREEEADAGHAIRRSGGKRRTCHLAGFSGHEHGLGSPDRQLFRREIRQGKRDSLAQDRGRQNESKRGRPAAAR
jgi:RNA polymerase sigma-70 factor (ECF subfamily)